MRLKSFVATDRLVIYREKWGALAAFALLGTGCLAFAVGFYWLMVYDAKVSNLFVTLFCGLFGLAGGLILLRLPELYRQFRKEKGLHELVADRLGITLPQGLGAASRIFPWSEVAELRLAENLKLIDPDETVYVTRAIVIFLHQAPDAQGGWLERVRLGVSRSGKKRPYLLGYFPRYQGATILAALRSLVPVSMPVGLEKHLVFDTKLGADSTPMQ